MKVYSKQKSFLIYLPLCQKKDAHHQALKTKVPIQNGDNPPNRDREIVISSPFLVEKQSNGHSH